MNIPRWLDTVYDTIYEPVCFYLFLLNHLSIFLISGDIAMNVPADLLSYYIKERKSRVVWFIKVFN